MTDQITDAEAIIHLQAGLMAANPTGGYGRALTLAINRLSEPSVNDELLAAAREIIEARNYSGPRFAAAFDRLRAAIQSPRAQGQDGRND